MENEENKINVITISPSLYGLLQGENPIADKLLGILNLQREEIPRYRDISLNEDGSEIVVRTRTGGGNREDYEVKNDQLCAHQLYIRDEDDDFDCTYAYFHFRVPNELKEWTKAHSTGEPVQNMQEILDGWLKKIGA